MVLSLCRAFPGAPIHTSLYDPAGTFPEFAGLAIHTGGLHHMGPFRRNHRVALPFLASSFSRMNVGADVVICSSSGWAHGVPTDGRKVVYCHNPARWLYQADGYEPGRGRVASAGLSVLRHRLRSWDLQAARSAHRYLANSTVVRDRIWSAYGIDAEVVPPPYALDVHGAQRPVEALEPGFLLCVSRLMSYKHVDAVTEGMRGLPGHRLVVVGTGPEEAHLRATAPPNVVFAGSIDDDELRWLYANCAGLVSASHEDFGLTPVEAAAFGKPSALLRWGGFLDSLDEGISGLYFDEPTPLSAGAAMRQLVQTEWDPHAIRDHASKYSEERFMARIREIAADEAAIAHAAVLPPTFAGVTATGGAAAPTVLAAPAPGAASAPSTAPAAELGAPRPPAAPTAPTAPAAPAAPAAPVRGAAGPGSSRAPGGAANRAPRLVAASPRAARPAAVVSATRGAATKAAVAAADLGAVTVAMLAAFLVWSALRGTNPENFRTAHFHLGLLSLPVWLAAIANAGLYRSRIVTSRMEELRRVARATIVAVLGIAAASALTRYQAARLWLVLSASFGFVALVAARSLVRAHFIRQRRAGLRLRRVVVVGTNDEAMELAAALQRDPALGYHVSGFLSDEYPAGFRTSDGGVVLGSIDQALSAVRREQATGVLIVTTAVDQDTATRLTSELAEVGVHVELSSSLRDVSLRRMTIRPVGRYPMLYIEPHSPGSWRPMAKRAFDIVLASAALVFTAPFIVVAAIAIKLQDGGPVFFRQRRVGRGGVSFELIKLRSMVPDAEDRLAALLAANEATGPLFKLRNDPRVTRVGRFLRRSSLDELPQLWNVLRGDMSIVGPRPALTTEMRAWSPEMHARLKVRPGITGMWQVNGRSSATAEEYERLDLYYVNNWSLLTDVAIVLRTVPAVLATRGAY